MSLSLQQLPEALRRGLAPAYLVSGDEPQQVEESVDLIRAAAAAAGYDDRERWQFEAGFRWGEFFLATHTLGLFATRRLLELRAPVSELHGGGAEYLEHYAGQPPQEAILLVVTGKLEPRHTASRWFRKLDALGGVVRVWPLEGREFQHWLGSRLKRRGVATDEAGLRRLAELTEGNLLAAAQTVDQLALLATGKRLGVADIEALAFESARFDVYRLPESVLAGDVPRVLRVLENLHGEGEPPAVIVAVLARECRLLARMIHGQGRGRSLEQICGELRVWESRRRLYAVALRRLRLEQVYDAVHGLARTDRIVKGFEQGDVWQALREVCTGLCVGADDCRGIQRHP